MDLGVAVAGISDPRFLAVISFSFFSRSKHVDWGFSPKQPCHLSPASLQFCFPLSSFLGIRCQSLNLALLKVFEDFQERCMKQMTTALLVLLDVARVVLACIR